MNANNMTAEMELDAMLDREAAEVRNMEIAEGEALAELTYLISENALADLDALFEEEEWLLAS
ncbi:MAG: hypothetical protein HDQ87_03295 [Clostridia bacterium]|nr:hypothetical protein [Clostridia bacterium]